MKLYKITNGIGVYWVVAEHPTEACEKLELILGKYNYGFGVDRKPKTIEVIAEEIKDQFLTGKFLVL